MTHRLLLRAGIVCALFLICVMAPASAAETPNGAPSLTINLGDGTPQQMSAVVQILLLLTVLSLAPALIMMVTSFTRIVVVLSFLRHALGTQQSPPNQVLISLALFLTLFVMSPVWQKVNAEALQPYLEQKASQSEALERAADSARGFMLKQVREKDLALFVEMAKLPAPNTPSELPIHVVIPAFMISELRTAFQIGFLIFLPFLIIDIVVASILMSMGMMMLPPVMVSLPFKLILFVLADGWFLVVGSLVKSFA
ncbi:MAG: flagellar type III secretion system pore protein FliP [Candidatus Manganitrophus sp. SA1]|nr:flagellar type III secretion system pore protein FliP [Candidatus Manganitrophus morganii]